MQFNVDSITGKSTNRTFEFFSKKILRKTKHLKNVLSHTIAFEPKNTVFTCTWNKLGSEIMF